MGCSKAFRGNANCTKHPRNDTSHVGFSRSVSRENMTRPGEVKKMSQKQPKSKIIIHAFGLSRSEGHKMTPRGMEDHWK